MRSAINFNSSQAARTYSDREADATWFTWCQAVLAPQAKDVVDIGCGGGIYSRSFAALHARSVIGIDQSTQYVAESSKAAIGIQNVSFLQGTACATGLAAGAADIIFERALVHHLSGSQQAENAVEAKRLLRPAGVLCVQDRTVEDAASDDEDFWIRSTLMKSFPQLLEFERARRPSRTTYQETLRLAGFRTVEILSHTEVRKTYTSFKQLETEILARKGKSILFELSDHELRTYCSALQEYSQTRPLIERDLWTVWRASGIQ
jgi:SAM-dependent methyltransferase